MITWKKILGCPVDLGTPDSLEPYIIERVMGGCHGFLMKPRFIVKGQTFAPGSDDSYDLKNVDKDGFPELVKQQQFRRQRAGHLSTG